MSDVGLPGTAPAFASNGTLPATVDIVIPVLNEERALTGCIHTLYKFLNASFPLPWRITIVDNGSTDGTWALATELAVTTERVHARRLDIRGKGAAVKTAWRDSPADIVAYMDVDLSTGLGALLPLIAPLATGHAEIAIGTRLAAASRIHRGPKRELVSRGYNLLLRYGFGAHFSDAACGFKAARADVVRPLLDEVADDSWFFDTELLLLAEYNGLRVQEVPVDWIEDVDTRVDVCRTAISDLKGLLRVTRAMSSGSAVVAVPPVPALTPAHPDAVLATPCAVTLAKLASFAAIGAASTVAHTAMYALLREVWPPALANLLALITIAAANTEANRRWTFNRAGGPRIRVHTRAGALFLLNFAVTSGAVVGLHAVAPGAGRGTEILALLTASGVMTILRFVALDRWVFARPMRRRAAIAAHRRETVAVD